MVKSKERIMNLYLQELRSIVKRFYGATIIGHGDINTLVFFCVLIDFWWSFIFLLPFDTYVTTPSYKVLSTLVSEVQLGVIFLLLCLAFTTSLWKKYYSVLKITCVFNMIIWFFISYTLLLSNPYTTGAGVYFIVGLATGFIYLRLAQRY